MVEQIKELSDEVVQEVDKLAEQGNNLFDNDDFEGAIAIWKKGLALIYEPHHLYSQAAWFEVAIGDGYFSLKDYLQAAQYFGRAKNNVDFLSYSNPFVMLRYGQVMLELGDVEQAKEYLLRAYGLDDEGDLFSEDDPKYFKFLQAHVEDFK